MDISIWAVVWFYFGAKDTVSDIISECTYWEKVIKWHLKFIVTIRSPIEAHLFAMESEWKRTFAAQRFIVYASFGPAKMHHDDKI